jgi:hypothetical protein
MSNIYPLADVIEFRRDSKERHIEHLRAKKSQHEQQIARHAQEVRWINLELESLGVNPRG